MPPRSRFASSAPRSHVLGAVDTMSEAADHQPLNDAARARIRGVIDALVKMEETTGGFTSKVDARQTGCSVHVRFENKVGVNTSLDFWQQIVESPAMLADACRRLLAADAALSSLGDEAPARPKAAQ